MATADLEAAQDLLHNSVKQLAVIVAVAAQLHIRPAHGCQLGSGEACHIVLHHVAHLHQTYDAENSDEHMYALGKGKLLMLWVGGALLKSAGWNVAG